MAKWLGKQISYLIGILLNVVGASLIFFIDSETMKAYGIFYVVFIFLGEEGFELFLNFKKVDNFTISGNKAEEQRLEWSQASASLRT